jgi:transcriptional regulator with XRE-family HTH domain
MVFMIEQFIAKRIAGLRIESGLTLRALGAKTGLSEAYLSRVENGQTAVTIANLEKIAQVFSAPLTTFFKQEEATQPLVLCRNGSGKTVRFRGARGTLVSMLAAEKEGKLMEPLIVDVSSAPRKVPLQAHAGEEFNYVIEGQCRFLYGRTVHTLSEGDSVYFDATIEHATHAIQGKPCRLLAIISSQDMQFHRNISKVAEDRIQA